MLIRGVKSPIGVNKRAKGQGSSSSKRKRESPSGDGKGEESNEQPTTSEGEEHELEDSTTPPSNAEELDEAQRRPNKAPMVNSPTKEVDGIIFQPSWNTRDEDTMEDVIGAMNFMMNMHPNGERERVRNLPRSKCEGLFMLCQANATSYAMELYKRSQEDKAMFQHLEREIAHRGQVITSLQASAREQVEGSKVLKERVAFLEDKSTKLGALEEERTMEIMELRRLVEELSSKVDQGEHENFNLRESLNDITSKLGSGLGEQEMSEMAKREGCRHFLKSEGGQGLVLRLMKGSCKAAFIEAQEAVRETYPEYSLPESQAIIGDDAVSETMPWEDDFSFECSARPYPSPPPSVESTSGEKGAIVGGDDTPLE